MANLYADSNFYITDVTYGPDTTGNNSYDVSWSYTGNNLSSNFTVLADNLISNVQGTGKVISIDNYYGYEYPEGNAFTTEVVSQSTSSNAGSGFTIQVSANSTGDSTLGITANGTGYYYSDSITFPAAPLHRNSDLVLRVSEDDHEGIDYFPTGLADADVVANAVPLMNLEYGF